MYELEFLSFDIDLQYWKKAPTSWRLLVVLLDTSLQRSSLAGIVGNFNIFAEVWSKWS